jgi:hydroxyacylglutathione hydrolase
MTHAIETICLARVNSYLLAGDDGYVLVDTGKPEKREALDARLTSAGCGPGDLKLIVITHGDYDHAGNAAFLREKHGCTIAMHRSDAGRVMKADWRLGMKPKPDKFPLVFRVASLFIRPGWFETFRPNLYLEDEQKLGDFGVDATVLHLPGHTRGSIGVLTSAGDLFCGDLMDSMMGRPSLQFFINDMKQARASLARLRELEIGTVYPGHGRPFTMAQVKERRSG